MNCYNHINEAAVATCVDCGKGLCYECAHAYTTPICNACYLVRIKAERSSIQKRWRVSLGVAIILNIIFYSLMPIYLKDTRINMIIVHTIMVIISLYIFVSITYGWRALTSITPIGFYINSLIDRITMSSCAFVFQYFILFIIKAAIAIIVGFFITPYNLFKEIKRYREINSILRLMSS